jgi:hypothetical protein
MRLFLLLTFFISTSLVLLAQKPQTTVHGMVKDLVTGEGLPYVTVTFDGVGIGVRSDINGKFFMSTDRAHKSIKLAYVGYETQTILIKTGEHNEVEVLLKDGSSQLDEITIRPKKYSRKNNPAVDLVEEVFKHKDENRKEGLAFYSFEKYEKLQMNLNNITDSYRKKWYFRPFRFIFSNVDTNAVTQKVALPIYLRERLLTAYYRKDPGQQKSVLIGQRQSGFHDEENQGDDLGVDGEGVSQFLSSSFSDVDIYEPSILLLGTQFIGPLSSIANSMYRFYIIDTVEYHGKKYADLYFSPKNKADLAFMGNMLVALDSTYAVMKVEMGVPKDINLNFVSDMHIEQQFERVGTGKDQRLMLDWDVVSVDLKVLKTTSGRSLLTRKSSQYRNYTINQPLPDTLFKSPEQIRDDTGKVRSRSTEWWTARRYTPLNHTEHFIEKMIDSIKQVPIFKLLNGVGTLLGTGFQRIGFVDIGSPGTFYNYNPIEGSRLKLTARTNAKLYKPLVLSGYGAYGFRDQKWKYNASVTYSFNHKVPRVFPQNQLIVSYEKDLRIPGLLGDRMSQDNTFTSLQRGQRNRMLFNQVFKIEYVREFKSQLSFNIAAQQKIYSSAGLLLFEVSGSDPENPTFSSNLNTTELGAFVRYAPNQKFYTGANYRYPIQGKSPVFTLAFRNGFKALSGQYAFQKLVFSAEKRFFVAPLGISDWLLNAGRTWGSVPYPLLEAHPANQSYLYDWYAFNLMNFLEFVSDKYVTLNIQHNFNGLIFNKIPVIKKLRWREKFSLKALYGGLDNRSNPYNTTGLFQFPKDENGRYITNILGKKPYIEMSVGVANIFNLFRVDYVWRANYLDLPDAPHWGIRVMASAKF